MTTILGRVWPRINPALTTLVLLLCMVLSFKNALSYYIDYTPFSRYYLAGSNDTVAQHLGKFLQTQPSDTQVIFFGHPRMGYRSISSLQYLAPKIDGLDVLEPWGSEQNPKPDSDHLIFVFLPQNAGEISLVQADYPGGKLLEETTYWKKILYYYYIYEK